VIQDAVLITIFVLFMWGVVFSAALLSLRKPRPRRHKRSLANIARLERELGLVPGHHPQPPQDIESDRR
jgi:uncharacterized membrane protein